MTWFSRVFLSATFSLACDLIRSISSINSMIPLKRLTEKWREQCSGKNWVSENSGPNTLILYPLFFHTFFGSIICMKKKVNPENSIERCFREMSLERPWLKSLSPVSVICSHLYRENDLFDLIKTFTCKSLLRYSPSK